MKLIDKSALVAEIEAPLIDKMNLTIEQNG
jgi:hypothetical protein